MVAALMDRDGEGVARAWGEAVVPRLLAGVLAAGYLAAVLTEAAKSGTSARWLPSPVAYFTQVAALFPRASRTAIEYRVEGFQCREGREGRGGQWVEIDVRPWFPIDADNKENRFYRAMHFYHDHRQTMRALDEFVVGHYNADAVDAAAQGNGRELLGGVRFVRLLLPFGDPGEGTERYARKALAEQPADQRKDLYWTPESKREERCARIRR